MDQLWLTNRWRTAELRTRKRITSRLRGSVGLRGWHARTWIRRCGRKQHISWIASFTTRAYAIRTLVAHHVPKLSGYGSRASKPAPNRWGQVVNSRCPSADIFNAVTVNMEVTNDFAWGLALIASTSPAQVGKNTDDGTNADNELDKY